MGRVKKEEAQRRINRAEELLIECPTASGAMKTIMEECGITERPAWSWLKKARERWADEALEMGTDERHGARERMRRTLRYVQGRGFRSGELRVVLGATRQLRDLDGLDVPKELRLSGAIGMVDTSTVFQERSTEDLILFLRTGRLPPEKAETVDE